MRKPNFSKLSTDVLIGYKSDIEALLKERKKTNEKKSKLLKRVKSIVESEGLSMQDFLSDAKPVTKTRKGTVKKVTRKVKPKYANPEDPDQKWSGRGRQPLWVVAHLQDGGSIDDLAI